MYIATPHTTVHTSTQYFGMLPILLYHFVPGVVIMLSFTAMAWLAAPLGWPPNLALLFTWLLVGIPVVLALLFYQGHRHRGSLSFDQILLYRQPLPWRQYTRLVPALLIWAAVASTLLYPLGEFIRLHFFAGWPNWLNLSTLAQNPSQYTDAILWTIVALSAVLNIAVPITEELYFRSFLLPRLPVSAPWAPLLSTVLFSLYHFWLPWDIVGRIVTLLPVVYAVQWQRNVYVSILVHCLLNLLGTIGLAVVILSNGS